MSLLSTVAPIELQIGMEPSGTETDMLNRKAFVEQMFDIVELLSQRKKNACFALNGRWGVGKTFVLNLFEKRAEQYYMSDPVMPQFLVFRYNCWEFDYYEEPLVAIVSSMLEEIEKKTWIIPGENKEKLKGILKEVRSICEKSAASVLEKQLGLEPGAIQSVINAIKSGVTTGKDKAEKAKEYDENMGFNKALKALRKEVENLATDQTVVFIVDELDRCLPEYMIKVLERLHHLFNGIANVQVIFSIDAEQLEHTVKQIYGPETDAKKYLQKFMQFELKLDEGDFSSQFDERFPRYRACFLENSKLFVETVFEFRDMILQGIDMRRRIEIVERCHLLHMLLADVEEENGEGPKRSDTAYLCLELFLAVLHDCRIDVKHARESFSIEQVFQQKDFSATLPSGLRWMSEQYRGDWVSPYFSQDEGKTYIDAVTMLGSLLRVYRGILGFNDEILNCTEGRNAFIEFGSDFWKLLESVS